MVYKSVVVGTTPTLLCPFNNKRVSLTLHNNSSVNVYISQDPANIREQGMVLVPHGYASLVKVEGDEPQYAMYAVAETGTADVRVHEGVSGGWFIGT